MKNLNSILLILTALVLSGCSYLSNNNEDEKKIRIEQAKKDRILEVNKDFEFLAKSVSYKYDIPIDTINIVLREYYKGYEGYSFNEKSNKLEDADFPIDEIHKLDFIKRLVNANKINEKIAFLIFDEIDLQSKLENIESDLYSIESEIDDINSKTTK